MANHFPIFNFTPHSITVCDKVFESVGEIRLKEEIRQDPVDINGFPVFEAPKYIGLDGLPKLKEGETVSYRIWLVSMPVGKYAAENPDEIPFYVMVCGPNTSPDHVIRNKEKQIIGTKSLVRYLDFQ